MQDYQIINIQKDGIKPDAFHGDYHIHLLGKAGRMDFMLGNRTFSVHEGDLLVWQMSTDFTDIRFSDDFDAEMLLISNPFLATYNPEQVWATRGYVYFKSNPVFHLENGELILMETDFRAFRLRIGAPMKLFSEEIVGEMLRIFLYDLWNVYSDEIERAQIDDITSRHFLRFLMLVQQRCTEQREVGWYARELGLAPKYLSEISKDITGKPASDWIETYTAHELIKLLSDTRLTLTDITDRLHFSSQAMLTRYMKRTVGKTPTEYRKQIIRQ